MIDVPYGTWGSNHHYYCTPGDCACIHAVKNKNSLNKKVRDIGMV